MDKQLKMSKFNESLSAFYASRLIIVDKTISDFLKMIAQEVSFMEIIADAVRTANFAQEYQKAIVNDENGLSFKLPMNKRHVVALVVGLLFEFDKKNISVIEFVRKFYPFESSHDSYVAFTENVIRPFGECFKSLYLGEEETSPSLPIEEENDKPFNDKAKEECDYWLRLITGGIMGDSSFNKVERKDALSAVKGMSYVLELANPILIKIAWIGLKYTLGTRKSTFRELKEVESILITYGVIE